MCVYVGCICGLYMWVVYVGVSACGCLFVCFILICHSVLVGVHTHLCLCQNLQLHFCVYKCVSVRVFLFASVAVTVFFVSVPRR